MKRVVIFAHYDSLNVIDDYVIYYLRQLRTVADKIVFVSDNNLPAMETKKLEKIVDTTIAKRHGEYDFGSYKYGYQAIENELNCFDELILCNDSCFGPFHDLRSYFQQMFPHDYDMWGMMGGTFVQSFFLVLKQRLFLSTHFREFINGICQQNCKSDVVEKYEKGLSRLIGEHHGKTGCILKFSKKVKIPVPAEVRRDCLGIFLHSKPTDRVYDDNVLYLLEADFPLMKKLALMPKDNLLHYYWREIISCRSDYPVQLISNYIQRAGYVPFTKRKIICLKVIAKINFGIHYLCRFFLQVKYDKQKVIIKFCKIQICKYHINQKNDLKKPF